MTDEPRQPAPEPDSKTITPSSDDAPPSDVPTISALPGGTIDDHLADPSDRPTVAAPPVETIDLVVSEVAPSTAPMSAIDQDGEGVWSFFEAQPLPIEERQALLDEEPPLEPPFQISDRLVVDEDGEVLEIAWETASVRWWNGLGRNDRRFYFVSALVFVLSTFLYCLGVTALSLTPVLQPPAVAVAPTATRTPTATPFVVGLTPGPGEPAGPTPTFGAPVIVFSTPTPRLVPDDPDPTSTPLLPFPTAAPAIRTATPPGPTGTPPASPIVAASATRTVTAGSTPTPNGPTAPTVPPANATFTPGPSATRPPLTATPLGIPTSTAVASPTTGVPIPTTTTIVPGLPVPSITPRP
ncbi:MAG: hypothetical protein U0556_09035 [Dehalococcoidia bacterium]